MTTYNASAVDNTTIAFEKPITLQQGRALRDNPLAQLEGAANAPYNQYAWHPYDGVTRGDGNDGKLYDSATDGAVATVTSPDFDDGYEYRFVFIDIQTSGGTGSADVYYEMYRETSGSYNTAASLIALASGSNTASVAIDFLLMRTASLNKIVGASSVALNISQKVTRVRFSGQSSSNIDGGKIYMLRRLAMV